MILLDTHFLIRLLVVGSVEASSVKNWYRDEDLAASAIAWYELLSGPIGDEGVAVVRAMIRERILPFTEDQAKEASRLWNATGRLRSLRIDAMIAATAIIAKAELATANLDDFRVFEPLGLRLREWS